MLIVTMLVQPFPEDRGEIYRTAHRCWHNWFPVQVPEQGTRLLFLRAGEIPADGLSLVLRPRACMWNFEIFYVELLLLWFGQDRLRLCKLAPMLNTCILNSCLNGETVNMVKSFDLKCCKDWEFYMVNAIAWVRIPPQSVNSVLVASLAKRALTI